MKEGVVVVGGTIMLGGASYLPGVRDARGAMEAGPKECQPCGHD